MMKTKLSRAKSYFLLALLTLSLVVPYVIVSIFAGIVPLLHLSVFWAAWMIAAIRLKPRIALAISPFFAFFLLGIPSPNYWEDLFRFDFSSAWNDYLFGGGFHSEASISQGMTLVVNVVELVFVWLIVICAGRTARSLANRDLLQPRNVRGVNP